MLFFQADIGLIAIRVVCCSMNEVLFFESDIIPYRMMKPVKKGCICNFIPKLK